MTTTNYVAKTATPEAFVTKGKQRLRQNEGTVYLQNGDSFEIELYNPTQEPILAQISLNQESLGGGIVLRPGERVFLERYFDDKRKFKFDTYKVEDTIETELATFKNGYVEVTFHKKKNITFIPTSSRTILYDNTNPWYTNYNHTGSPVFGGEFTTTIGGGDLTFNTTNISSEVAQDSLRGSLGKTKSIETGRIEKGEVSNQNFHTVDTEFDVYSFHNVAWRILPKSREVVTTKQLNKIYCTECGSRIKKSTFKFCPNCGTKID